MKIYAYLLTETPNIWHREIMASLHNMGHQVFSPVNLGLNETFYKVQRGYLIFKQKEELSRKLLQDVKRVHQKESLDLFFIYMFPFQFSPHIFREIERLGIPTVLFYCDNLNSHIMAEEFSKYFTLTWVPELKAVDLYKKRRCNYIYLPMAANPNLDKPLGLEEKRELLFIGGKTPYRRWFLGAAMSKGLSVEIYGNYWLNGNTFYDFDDTPKTNFFDFGLSEKIANYFESKKRSLKFFIRYGPGLKRRGMAMQRLGEQFENLITHCAHDPVLPERVIELYSESKVTLGINHYVDPGCSDLFNLTYSKARDLEAPMSGACYLTQYTEELDNLYPEKDTLMTYKSLDELCEKSKVLLADRKLRDLLRKNARRFCLENHTWSHRFRELFRKLGLNEKGHNHAVRTKAFFGRPTS